MNQFKIVGLLGLLSALLITISYWLIDGWTRAFIGIALATVTNLESWYFSDRIGLFQHLLKLEQELLKSNSYNLSR